MFGKLMLGVLLVWLGNLAHADTPPIHNAARGELLYEMHCTACHNTQVHWRDKKLATDWVNLQAEVQRWQKFSNLGWGEDDVAAVARYLNALYYRHPAPD